MILDPPYRTVLKPYGSALLELARERHEVVCLSGDLTRQCEVDLFQDALPQRFIHAGMAEANMIGVAAALARTGLIPFVHTFGVFATRRPYDQIVNAVGYPGLPVRIVGFMPGISSPGGPSHQAIDDVALMRAIPGMTVIDVADAVETRQVARAVVDLPGPVYIRLKRGEIPVLFDEAHELSLTTAQQLTEGDDATVFASGMMLAPALAAERVLAAHGTGVSVVNVPVIKPIDEATVRRAAHGRRVVVTAENHLVTGGPRVRGVRGAGRGGRVPAAAPGRVARHLRRGSRVRSLPVREVRPVDAAPGRGAVVGARPRGYRARCPAVGAGRRRVLAGVARSAQQNSVRAVSAG